MFYFWSCKLFNEQVVCGPLQKVSGQQFKDANIMQFWMPKPSTEETICLPSHGAVQWVQKWLFL